MPTTPGGPAGATLITALVDEFAGAISGLVGVPGTVTATTGHLDLPWTITISVNAPTPLSLTIGLSKDDCVQLARLAGGGDAEPTDAAIIDILKEVSGQTVGALREKPAGKGLLFLVEAPVPPATPPAEDPTCFAIALTPEFEPIVAVWSSADQIAAQSTPPRSPAATVVASAGTSAGRGVGVKPNPAVAASVPANLEVILDIDLPLSVRFGQTDLSLDALTRLGPGSVIDLGRSPDDLVDVLVNGRLVARAEVVVVAGNYGVRILEVVSAADRVQSLRG
jgi:flagellar motor switch protein FliN